MGCGTGILTVQLALNGAAHVHAIDIDERAPWRTRSRTPSATASPTALSGERVDLYPWDPDERYEVVVASLYQMPNDPFEQLASHRPLDYWGRSLLDHLISLLPSLLAEDGGRLRDAALDPEPGGDAELARAQRAALARRGLRLLRVQPELFHEYDQQIARVEELSDAYHLTFGETDMMVAYLLEIRFKEGVAPRPPRTPS